MQVSIPGLTGCAAILIVAYYSRGMLVIGLIASMAFVATAAMILTALERGPGRHSGELGVGRRRRSRHSLLHSICCRCHREGSRPARDGCI